MNPFAAQAQQSFSNPAASPVPQANPIAAIANHPIVQAILKAVSSGAGAYGWTSMPPQQRLEAQQLEAQKAEAMARLGQEQQRIGMEGQRVGFEGQRTAAQVGESGARQKQAEAETTAIPKRTAIEQQTANTAQQRADQEHQDRIAENEVRLKQLEEETRSHKETERIGQGRLSVEQRANELAADRIDMEKEHFEGQIAMQGKQYTRQLAEDERKQLHTSLDEYYKTHPWLANITGTGAGSIQQKHKDIDDYIDKKIGVMSGPAGQGGTTEFERKPDGTIGPKGAKP